MSESSHFVAKKKCTRKRFNISGMLCVKYKNPRCGLKLADRRLNKHAYMLHTRKASKDTLHAAFIQATRALTQDSHVSVRLSLQFETKYFSKH